MNIPMGIIAQSRLCSGGPTRKIRETIPQREEHKHRCARSKVRYQIKIGNMRRLPCEVCVDPQTHAHHDNYDKPLEVRWLCRKHHADLHN